MRVAVVGAGVLGASLAHHLRFQGADVTLIEAVGAGSGSSSRGAGILAEGGWHGTSIRLVRRSLDLLATLAKGAEEEGIPFRLTTTGSTTLVPAALAPAARAQAKVQRDAGADVQEVRPEDVPALPLHAGIDLEGVAAAFHYPRDAWALPRIYCEILALLHESQGGALLRGAARLDVREGRARVRVGEQEVDADHVVVASGIHSRALLRAAGLDAPLLAYRTQAARVAHPRASSLPILHDAVNGCYLRPHTPGLMLVGDGTTTRPEDPLAWKADADEAFVASSLARVRRRFPFLADARSSDAWAGLDAATPDRLLLAGRHPDAEGLWLLAGGNGHGFMRAPAVGESLASIIMGEKPRIDLSAYDPARFAGRMSDDFAIREGYALEATTFMGGS